MTTTVNNNTQGAQTPATSSGSLSSQQLQEMLTKMLLAVLSVITQETKLLASQQDQQATIAQINTNAAIAQNNRTQAQVQDELKALKEAEDEPWWEKMVSVVVKYVLPAIAVLSSAAFGPETLLLTALSTALTMSPAGTKMFSAVNDLISDMGLPTWANDMISFVVDAAIVIALTKGAGAGASSASAVDAESAEAVENASKFTQSSKLFVQTTVAANLISSSNMIAQPVTDILKAAGVSDEYAQIIGQSIQALVTIVVMLGGAIAASGGASMEGIQINQSKLGALGSKIASFLSSDSGAFSRYINRGVRLFEGLFTLGNAGVSGYKSSLYFRLGNIQNTLIQMQGNQAVIEGANSITSRNASALQDRIEQAMQLFAPALQASETWATPLYTEAQAMLA